MSSRPIIQVEGLSKRYIIGHQVRHDTLVDTLRHGVAGLWSAWRRRSASAKEEFWALRDLSFDVRPGEVLGIIGRNGAGKSTLLKILSRITEPTTGRVTLRGRVASLLEVGTGFHPDLSGRDNIFLNGAILGMTRAETRRKFDEIVAFAEVEKFIDTPVKRYSSGMYVRLAFAVAAHLEPEILIVDEVLSVGDVSFQRKCLGKMEEVSKGKGRTVIFVSHNTDTVIHLCSSAILLQNGCVAASGNAVAVVARYMAGGGGTDTYLAPANKTHGLMEITTTTPNPARTDLEFRIKIKTPEPLANLTVGFVVFTLGGSPLFGSNTLFHPWRTTFVSRSSGEATVAVRDVPLWSGTYRASFWLSNGVHGVDHVPDAVMFDVFNPRLPANAPSARDIGSIHVPAEWHFSA